MFYFSHLSDKVLHFGVESLYVRLRAKWEVERQFVNFSETYGYKEKGRQNKFPK